MMTRRTFALSATLLPLVLSLGGCGDDRWKDYSYKMTVYADGKAYSTVRHVTVTEGASIQSSSGRRVDRKVEGEAVIIDTPSGPVFALMTPADGQFGNGFYAAYVAEKYAGGLTAYDIQFLTLSSGYESLDSTSCSAATTVND